MTEYAAPAEAVEDIVEGQSIWHGLRESPIGQFQCWPGYVVADVDDFFLDLLAHKDEKHPVYDEGQDFTLTLEGVPAPPGVLLGMTFEFPNRQFMIPAWLPTDNQWARVIAHSRLLVLSLPAKLEAMRADGMPVTEGGQRCAFLDMTGPRYITEFLDEIGLPPLDPTAIAREVRG